MLAHGEKRTTARMEPTGVNANRCARLPGGRMMLAGAEKSLI
jgi:hypothetical protein